MIRKRTKFADDLEEVGKTIKELQVDPSTMEQLADWMDVLCIGMGNWQRISSGEEIRSYIWGKLSLSYIFLCKPEQVTISQIPYL